MNPPATSLQLNSYLRFLTTLFILTCLSHARALPPASDAASARQMLSLSGSGWQFTGTDWMTPLPAIDSDGFRGAAWTSIEVPHVFEKRGEMSLQQGWYRRSFTVPHPLTARHFYLVFEGAAAIADVYVNGKYLGQHRGAYTRFVFDATAAMHPGANELAVQVNNRPGSITDCLPNGDRLYTVWGGLYRHVWLLATHDLQIDPTYYASPGVFITSTNVTSESAQLQIKVLLLNTGAADSHARVTCTLLDPTGRPVRTFSGLRELAAGQKASLTFDGDLSHPALWSPKTPSLYHLRVDVADGSRPGSHLADSVTQPVGFRDLAFDFKQGTVKLNGQPIIFYGADSHQEVEKKASAIEPEDLMVNYEALTDLGANFVRLPHYPHAQFEYDLCDKRGLFCWAENGHSNNEKPTPTADQITTEMVMQNFNHPSIAMWSVGNEASPDTAQQEVPVVRALDPSRPVMVANMKCENADYHGVNTYPGWYGGDRWRFKPHGIITEVGAGGVVTCHTDYAAATHTVNHFEPEEYQQLVAETEMDAAFRHNEGQLGLFCWWTLREFNDRKYKVDEAPFRQGINSKGLLTYAGDKKDVYYLYRCFARTDVPTIHITSKRYFLRKDAVDNGVKVYSSGQSVTLSLNGENVSTLPDGQYVQPDPSAATHQQPIAHVFYWKVPLRTGKNVAVATDDQGNRDEATIYFEGANGSPEAPARNPLITNLVSSNPKNPAYYMDMPVQPQWPVYDDLDSTADNSLDILPPEVQGASWIALNRVTKPGEQTDVGFTVPGNATVYVICTEQTAPPANVTAAGFRLCPAKEFSWRDNTLHLVPAQLYARTVEAGEVIKLSLGERDALVLVKGAPHEHSKSARQ